MYKIVRCYIDNDRAPNRRTIKTGLTLEEARAHCRDPETSSKTCKKAVNRHHTKQYGPWFDGYEEM